MANKADLDMLMGSQVFDKSPPLNMKSRLLESNLYHCTPLATAATIGCTHIRFLRVNVNILAQKPLAFEVRPKTKNLNSSSNSHDVSVHYGGYLHK